MAAGIISRIIGLLYRGPLTAIIGDEGNGYYTTAYNIYAIILLLSSYSIPSAVSKVIAQKLALRQFKNAHRIFICSLWYVIAVGGVASLFVFFFGDLLASGQAVTVLKVFAPTIFLSGLLGVLRGYFQAHKTMFQTSVSQILEQILHVAVSILTAFLLIYMTMGSMNVYREDNDTGKVTFGNEEVKGTTNGIDDVLGIYEESTSQEDAATDGTETDEAAGSKEAKNTLLTAEQQEWNTRHAVLGAAGSAIGIGAGVFGALLFMYAIYRMNSKTIRRRMEKDIHSEEDSYGEIFKLLLSVVTPFILSTAIYNLSTFLNQTIYINIMSFIHQTPEVEIYTAYGIYGGKAVVISNIPIALASAMSSAILPSISEHYVRKEIDLVRAKIAEAIRMSMLISIPATVGIAVLSKPITQILFPQRASLDLASNLLCALSISIIFYTLSTITNAALQGIGKVNRPIIHATIALVVQSAVLVPVLIFTNWNLYALVLANIVYSGIMCLLNGFAIRKFLDYRQEKIKTYVTPFAAAVFMGAFAYGAYHGLYYLLPSNSVCTVVAIVVAVITYFVLIIKFGGLREEEMRQLPKGEMLIRAAKKLRLIRR